eukprot:gene528-293_t
MLMIREKKCIGRGDLAVIVGLRMHFLFSILRTPYCFIGFNTTKGIEKTKQNRKSSAQYQEMAFLFNLIHPFPYIYDRRLSLASFGALSTKESETNVNWFPLPAVSHLNKDVCVRDSYRWGMAREEGNREEAHACI